jgi:hypothetical protein
MSLLDRFNMSMNRREPELKFPAGRFEDSLLTLIIALQASIGVMSVLGGFFRAHLVANSYLMPQEEFTFYLGILALAIGMAASVYLLQRLYE